MNNEMLKTHIGKNIVLHRKRCGYTQAGLAEKLHYSDKAISKWERGESVPDVLILVQLAELFHITVNDLLSDPNALPENPGKVERVMDKAVQKALKRKANKITVLMLSSVLVWFVALFLFVVLSTFDFPESWLAFLYAIPVNAVVLLSMQSAWGDFRWNLTLISLIMWGSLLSIFTTVLVFGSFSFWKIFLLGIPGQAAIIMWNFLYRKAPKEERYGQENTAASNPSKETGDDPGND